MVKKNRRKPPSRIKYETEHPTVSCRVSREIYERLLDTKENEGRSFADVIKVGLGILEVKAEKEGRVFQRGYAEGYRDGSRDAESAFKVTYRCNICREIIVVDTEDERQAAGKYMGEHGWGHSSCHDRIREQ